MNKKIAAFVVNKYDENKFFGGGEKVNFYIINELLKRNYTIDLYADISFVDSSSLVNIIIKEKNFIKNCEDILKKYDLVISTNMECPSEITYSHSHSYMWNKGIFKLLFELLFKPSFFKRFRRHRNALKNAKKINKIVISSNIIKKDYIKNYNIDSDKLYILPPGVDYKDISIHYYNKDCFIFGLVGKSSIKKGVFKTLYALRHLKKRKTNFKVIIVNGEYSKYLICRILINLVMFFCGIKKYVQIVPLQDNLNDFYNSINCLLVPSLKEPYGLVVTEAMSNSIPVIISSVSGAIDLIKDGENGLIVNFEAKNKSVELASKMEMILDMSVDDYKNMSENAWKTVSDMSFEKFAQNFVDIAEK